MQNHVTMPNFIEMAQTAVEISQFLDFSKWRLPLFFKMAEAAILDFRNFRFVTVGTFNGVKVHHCDKFRQNRSKRGRDMLVLILSK